MPLVKVPIKDAAYKNTDSIANERYADELLDGYIDEFQVLNRRPAFTLWHTFTSAQKIDGLFWHNGLKTLFCVTNGTVHKVTRGTDGTYTFTDLTTSGVTLNIGQRASFVEHGNEHTGRKLVIANGSTYMCYYQEGDHATVIEGSDSQKYKCILTHVSSNARKPVTGADWETYWQLTTDDDITDIWAADQIYNSASEQLISIDQNIPDEMLNVEQIAYLDTYVIVKRPGTSDVGFSGVNDFKSYAANDYFTAEANQDVNKSILTSNGIIYVFGEKTIELYYDDGVTPFSRQLVIQDGTLSGYSPALVSGIPYYMNSAKQICRLIGGTVEPISGSYDKYIQTFETVDDAEGNWLWVDGKSFYVLNFPTENKTLAFDVSSGQWAEWMKWEVDTTKVIRQDRILGGCFAYCPDWGITVAGSWRENGKLYLVSTTAYQDEGDEIRTLKRSGHISHGNYQMKRSNALYVKIKRGAGLADNNEEKAYATIRWRDNGSMVWGNFHKIDLGAKGETNFLVKIPRCGVYRTRQYEIACSDNCPFALVDLEEDVEVLR